MKLLPINGLMPTKAERALEWAKLGDEDRDQVQRWCGAFKAAESCANVGAALEFVAGRLGTSVKTVRRNYDWARNGKPLSDGSVVFGWKCFIDARRTRLRDLDTAIPAATVQWWKQVRDQFKGRRNCLRQAYARCIAMWAMPGFEVPGYPEKPESAERGHPAGWSYPNFCRLCQEPKMTRLLATTGMKAASNYAFHVPQTRVGLEAGQYIMCDDLWHDFKVKRTMKSPEGRMLELFFMDLFSAKRVCYGLKCEVEDDETKVRRRLQERDMRFLTAALFSIHGYRKAGTTIICEAGTAVVRDDIARELFNATGGAIRVEMGKTRATPAYPGWYRGRSGGNPRFKAALESSNNLTHNASAMLIGQTGSNERVNAPEELHGRAETDKALLKAISGLRLSPQKLEMIRWAFMLQSQAADIVDNIYKYIDGRTEHDLEGWESAGLVTGEVRPDPRSPNWTPTYALPAVTEEQVQAVQALMRLPGCFRLRRLSPSEVWAREQSNLVKIPMSVLPQIIGRDLAVERKLNDHGSFLFEDSDISHEPLRFVGIAVDPHGHNILLKNGEAYSTFCNPFDQRFLLVCDAAGRYVGRCERVNKVCRADDEALHRAMGQAAEVNAGRMREFVARNAGHAEQRAEDSDVNRRILADAPVTRAERAEADEKSRAMRKFVPADLMAAGGVDDAAGEDGNPGGFSPESLL